MQSISTKFIAPTDKRGARIKAQTTSGTYCETFIKKENLDGTNCHIDAAKQLLAIMQAKRHPEDKPYKLGIPLALPGGCNWDFCFQCTDY